MLAYLIIVNTAAALFLIHLCYSKVDISTRKVLGVAALICLSLGFVIIGANLKEERTQWTQLESLTTETNPVSPNSTGLVKSGSLLPATTAGGQ